jgi:transcriptional regulator with XRE-family HTH domain
MSFIHDMGITVRRARIARQLTQQALATACGLSRQTIAQLEAGSFSDLGVRKVERVLAGVGLTLRLAPVSDAAAPRGARSRLGRLLGGRAAARRATALGLARATLHALRRRGVRARVIGSLAKGGFRATSDVDYLIEDRGRLAESQVTSAIERSMRGFAFDVVFAERADPVLLAMMREEAAHGASAVRAP